MGKHILIRLTGDFLIICLLIFINYLVKNIEYDKDYRFSIDCDRMLLSDDGTRSEGLPVSRKRREV